MATRHIDETRVRRLNEDAGPARGRYVLYWMQQSQRSTCNHALEYAIREANRLELPCVVAFGLTADYPDANLRHYRFMLEGLAETETALARRGIRLVTRIGHPPTVALDLARDAALLVCDRGYLRHQRAWRATVARDAECPVIQVESDVVVPVEVASDKREYAARTFRPRLGRHLDAYLVDLRTTPLRKPSLPLDIDGVELDDPAALLRRLGVEDRVGASARFRGGTAEARRRLRRFVEQDLPGYAEARRHPHRDCVSHLSPYLHFGQVSPLWVALRVDQSSAPAADREAFLEELLVRRELAMNFAHFSPEDYDRYAGLPEWARRTLDAHADDTRTHLYDLDRLAAAETHDPYWNAAMIEMRETGYLHNHLRMYWGKKVLEWQEDPETAYETLLELDNRYFLDGRDPASYANVGWIFGLHDRPWAERPVFGTVRYMSAGGLERKTDMPAYLERVAGLTGLSPGSLD